MFLNMLLILIGFSLIELSVSFSACNNNECYGFFKIGLPEIPKLETEWEKHEFNIYYPNVLKVDAWIGTRNVFKKYCYHGGDLDPRTGCHDNGIGDVMLPDKAEMMSWVARKKCKVGNQCKRMGKCWGSEAALCLQDPVKNPSEKWVSNKEFSEDRTPWLKFAYHTCVIDWQCALHQSEFDVDLIYDNKEVLPTIIGKTDEIYPLIGGNDYIITKDEKYSILIEEKVEIIHKVDFIECLVLKKSNEKICKVNTGNGEVIMDIKNNIGYHHNIIVIGLPRLDIPHFSINELVKSASLEDLLELEDNLKFKLGQLNKDVIKLLRVNREQDYVINEVIKSVSKIDDELIGNIINKKLKSIWFNKDIFKFCPCYDLQMPPGGNCHQTYIFKDGRIIWNEDKTQCVTLKEETVKPIMMYGNQTNFTFVSLDFPPPQGTTSSQEGWSWISENKESILGAIFLHGNISSNENTLNYIMAQTIGSFKVWEYFGKVANIMGILGFFISIFALCK